MNIVYWIQGQTFATLALQSAATFRKVYPEARFYFYTDQSGIATLTEEIKDLGPSLVCPWDPEQPAMVANVMAQADFCLSEHFDTVDWPTLFVDADVIAGDKRAIIPGADRCDVVLTARRHVRMKEGKPIEGVAKDMPYNYGVIWANPTREAKELFVWLRDRVAKMSPQLQNWYGNQVALREFAGVIPDALPASRTRMLPWSKVRVHYLDCEQYNYTPESADEDLSEKFLLHFKGGRKELMQQIIKEQYL
jgi:hypothetical protein